MATRIASLSAQVELGQSPFVGGVTDQRLGQITGVLLSQLFVNINAGNSMSQMNQLQAGGNAEAAKADNSEVCHGVCPV